MANNIKAVIFDLDGVLVTTDELHYQAWKQMADREGIYFDKVINNRLRGVSRVASCEIILEKADKTYTTDEINEMCTFKNDIYVQLLDSLKETDTLPFVRETLTTLKNAGIKVAIGSSSKNTKKILTKLGIIDWFDAIADGTDITHSKPDPEVFLCAAKKLGLEPADCAVVEDAHAGIEAAKAGGMLACAISDAVTSPIADHKMETLNDLVKIVIG